MERRGGFHDGAGLVRSLGKVSTSELHPAREWVSLRKELCAHSPSFQPWYSCVCSARIFFFHILGYVQGRIERAEPRAPITPAGRQMQAKPGIGGES